MIAPTPRAVISRLVWLANTAIVDPASATSREFVADLAEVEADLAAHGLRDLGGVPSLITALNELALKTLVLGGRSARLVEIAKQARTIVRDHFKQAGAENAGSEVKADS